MISSHGSLYGAGQDCLSIWSLKEGRYSLLPFSNIFHKLESLIAEILHLGGRHRRPISISILAHTLPRIWKNVSYKGKICTESWFQRDIDTYYLQPFWPLQVTTIVQFHCSITHCFQIQLIEVVSNPSRNLWSITDWKCFCDVSISNFGQSLRPPVRVFNSQKSIYETFTST